MDESLFIYKGEFRVGHQSVETKQDRKVPILVGLIRRLRITEGLVLAIREKLAI